MTIVTAEEAGKALGIIAQKMYANAILTGDGNRALLEEVARLKRGRSSRTWDMLLVRERPVTFLPARDKNGDEIKISLISRITVDQKDDDHPPFQSLDIAVELWDTKGKP